MLWSDLARWPADRVLPPEVRRHYRFQKYTTSREADLTGWRWPMTMRLMDLDARIGPRTLAELEHRRELVGAIEEIDQVLKWMRNTDWPFR